MLTNFKSLLSLLGIIIISSAVSAQTEVTFNLLTDCYANETSWGIYDASDTELIGAATGSLANQTNYDQSIILPDGTYELRLGDTYGDGLRGENYSGCGVNGDYSLVDEFGVTMVQMGDPDFDNEIIHIFTLPFVPAGGCVDTGACNYDSAAQVDDGSCEYLTCAGCMDSQADNYDDTATIDDGSCTYPPLGAIISAGALNTCPGGSLEFSGANSAGNVQTFAWAVTGPEAFNSSDETVSFTFGQIGSYNVELTVSDGTSSNSSSATVSVTDGDNLVITIEPDNYPQEISYQLLDDNANVIDEVIVGDLGAGTYTKTVCISSGCHSFVISDSYGDGLLGAAYYSLVLNGTEIINSSAYGNGETTPLNCPAGTSCFDPITAVDGVNTAIYDNSWFIYTPTQTGQFNVTTCGLATCNTSIWIYDYCQGLVWDDTVEGTIYFNDDDETCGPQSNVNPLFEAGLDYYIRIGDVGDDCVGDVDFEVSFIGAISGCLDINACNFEPLATVSDGVCYFNDDPQCDGLGPDLYLLQDVLQSSTYLTTLTNIQPDDCYIQEGCIAGTGDRDIVRFTTHIKNIGTQDYFIGQESDNTDQFEFDPCHGHYHYEGYAEYILYDNSGVEYPEIGFKNGFCVLDLECSDGGTAKYGCSNMGITAGCGDIYSSGLSCQWVDITTVPVGTYTMVARTNWDQSPDNNGRYELRYDNNWAQVCFSFDRDVDGNIIDFVVEPESSCTVPVDCLGEPFGTTQPDCNGDCPGLVVKGDANLSLEIEAADAQMYVTDILGNDAVVTPCSDMDSDNSITVSDAAVLSRCAIYGTDYIDESGVHNHCEWISEVVNQSQTTTLSIGNINSVDNYVDVFVLNPDNRIVGYEFEISGAELMSAENLYTADYTISPETTLGGNKVIGLSYSDESIAKNLTPTPLVRLYYTNLTAAEVCISNIIDIVNVEYHNTLTAIGNCASVSALDFAQFTSDVTTVCAGESVTFTDQSLGSIVGWSWNFSGGTPASSSDQNPVIVYNVPGVYDVTLIADDGTNTDPETKVGFITVTNGNTYYSDSDNDGFGDPGSSIQSCEEFPPTGYSHLDTDCDDDNEFMYPDAPSTGEGIDNDCSGEVDPDEELECEGDLNGDYIVSILDLSIVLSDYGCLMECTGDVNGDGVVTSSDVALFLVLYGTSCE